METYFSLPGTFTRNPQKTVVKAEVVPDAVPPIGRACLVVGPLIHNGRIDIFECEFLLWAQVKDNRNECQVAKPANNKHTIINSIDKTLSNKHSSSS